MSDINALPTFAYHLDPVKTGTFVESEATCPACEQVRGWEYQGPFFSEAEVSDLCPWCIADGTAAKKFNGFFLDGDLAEKVEGVDKLKELTERTPSYTGWQQETWPAHCGDYCAFVDYVGWDQIEPLVEELEADLDKFVEAFELDEEDLEAIENGGDMQGYLFKCRHCAKHRLEIDVA